jgi:hypothetical protein
MSNRIVVLLAIVVLVFIAPAALPQTEQAQPVYTYVSQFQVPRASWAQFAEDTEKTTDPVFERLMADGTILALGKLRNYRAHARRNDARPLVVIHESCGHHPRAR